MKGAPGRGTGRQRERGGGQRQARQVEREKGFMKVSTVKKGCGSHRDRQRVSMELQSQGER